MASFALQLFQKVWGLLNGYCKINEFESLTSVRNVYYPMDPISNRYLYLWNPFIDVKNCNTCIQRCTWTLLCKRINCEKWTILVCSSCVFWLIVKPFWLMDWCPSVCPFVCHLHLVNLLLKVWSICFAIWPYHL